MSPASNPGKKKQGKASPSLTDQALNQANDFLTDADNSTNADIRAARIEIAKDIAKSALDLEKERTKHQLKQEATPSANLILAVVLVLGIAVFVTCCFALVNYKGLIAAAVCSLAILIYLVIVGTILFLKGHLSQANFMKIIGWLEAYRKSLWSHFSGDRVNNPKAEEPEKP